MAAARRSEVAGGERRDHRDAQRRQRMADSRQVLPGRRVLLRVPLRARMHGGAAAPRREDGRRRVERHLRLAQRGGSRLVSRHARSPGQGDIAGAPAAGRRRAGSSSAAAPAGVGGGRRTRCSRRPWRGGRASGTRGRWSGFPANARRHARADSSPVERDEGRRVEHDRHRARCEHPAAVPERCRRHQRRRGGGGIRPLRRDRVARRRNRGSAVQGRVVQRPPAESGASRGGLVPLPDAGAQRVLLLVGS